MTGEKVQIEDPDTMEIKEIWQGGVDALQYLTIASMCMAIYRSKFIKEEWNIITQEELEQATANNRSPIACSGHLRDGQFKVCINDEWIPIDQE